MTNEIKLVDTNHITFKDNCFYYNAKKVSYEQVRHFIEYENTTITDEFFRIVKEYGNLIFVMSILFSNYLYS